MEKAPFVWGKVNTGKVGPSPRMYQSASLCKSGSAQGMLVVFGGRGADQKSINDTWGLRKHRDGHWDWVEAPSSKAPKKRYQHASVFLGQLLIVFGGRCDDMNNICELDVYDTETNEWTNFNTPSRFRHSVFASGSNFYIYGGFDVNDPAIPINEFQKIDS